MRVLSQESRHKPIKSDSHSILRDSDSSRSKKNKNKKKQQPTNKNQKHVLKLDGK